VRLLGNAELVRKTYSRVENQCFNVKPKGCIKHGSSRTLLECIAIRYFDRWFGWRNNVL